MQLQTYTHKDIIQIPKQKTNNNLPENEIVDNN